MEIKGSLQRRKYLYVVLPLFIASCLAFLDRLNISYAALTMNKALGFSAEIYGFGAGILFLGYVLFEVPGTVYASNRSPRKWLFRIMFTWGFACLLMAFIKTPMHFYIVRFLIGAAEASFYPVCYAVIFPSFFNAKERPRAISIMLISLLASNIIGSPMAGLLIGTNILGFQGWQTLFVIQGALAVFYSFFLLGWLKDKPEDCNWMTDEEKIELRAEINAEIAAKNKEKELTLWQALADKTVLKLSATYFLWVSGFWGFGFWLPTVLKSVSGLSNAKVSFLVIIPMSIAAIGFIWNGNHATKTRETRWHIAIPMFIGAFGMAAGTLTHNPTLSFICTCITCIGVYVGMGVWWTVPSSFLTGEAVAAATALINSIGNLGGWCGPYFVGWVKTTTGGYSPAFLVMAGMLVCAGLLMLTLPKKTAVSGLEEKIG